MSGSTVTRKRVIIVEDNSDDIMLYQRVFNRFLNKNYELLVFDDGEKALTYFKNTYRDSCLDCIVFLDIKMPRVSGLDLLQYLRSQEQWASAPVSMLTSSDQISDINKAYALGATSYIEKPKDYIRLKTQLPRIISYFDTEIYECSGYDRG